MKELWKDHYTPAPATVVASTIVQNDQDDLYIRLHNHKRVCLTPNATPSIDQLDKYLATDLVPEHVDHHPLRYWYERRFTQPELAKFAFDCLAIPLISDDPERSFSAGRGLITYRRSNLENDIIKACICLRSRY